METETETGCVIMAAGRGSRMKGFPGNKTLLPLMPENSPFEGKYPLLHHILENLPPGPKALVVHHKKQDVIRYTQGMGLTYCEQPKLNGTGGALLATRAFLERQDCRQFVLTMGDVPLVKKATYKNLLNALGQHALVVLGFRPQDRKEYGVLEIEMGRVRRIIEWKYWSRFAEERQRALQICNSGIYAARKMELLHYLAVLASNPHTVQKEINGHWIDVEEFFATDLVEYMSADGLPVGCVLAEDELEVMGVDDLSSLMKTQRVFRGRQT